MCYHAHPCGQRVAQGRRQATYSWTRWEKSPELYQRYLVRQKALKTAISTHGEDSEAARQAQSAMDALLNELGMAAG